MAQETGDIPGRTSHTVAVHLVDSHIVGRLWEWDTGVGCSLHDLVEDAEAVGPYSAVLEYHDRALEMRWGGPDSEAAADFSDALDVLVLQMFWL